jgi:hypothetical protein
VYSVETSWVKKKKKKKGVTEVAESKGAAVGPKCIFFLEICTGCLDVQDLHCHATWPCKFLPQVAFSGRVNNLLKLADNMCYISTFIILNNKSFFESPPTALLFLQLYAANSFI